MKIFFVIFLLYSTSSLAKDDTEKLVHIIDFKDYEIGSEEDWLASKSFVFREDSKRRNKIDLKVGDKGLLIEAKSHAFGLMSNESVNLHEFSSVEIDWGINKFPKDASYEKGLRNEALNVMIFMGDERISSGSMLIPNSPYFIGLFLCDENDRVNHPYIGAYHKKSGRYVCAEHPTIGVTVTTRFNLINAYKSFYDKENDDDPAISGIALEIDTKKSGDGGTSSAFISEIRFYR